MEFRRCSRSGASGNFSVFPENNEVVYARKFDDGEIEIIKPGRLKFIDDLFIFNLQRQEGSVYKIVLAGWRSGDTKLMFGYFYLYNEDGLFNGWPMAFAPKSKDCIGF